MTSVFLTDFKFGMDRRRKRIAGVPGTLWLGKNVVISRGGDIERARRFVPTYTLPTGTFGLASTRGQLYTFGSGNTPVGLPTGVQYQRLQSPDAAAMTQILDVKTVGGKFYAIARFASGHTYHFYDGARVTDWDALADGNTDMPTLAAYLGDLINADTAVTAVASGNTLTITANNAGTAFTVAQSTVDHGSVADQNITLTTVAANVAAVAEVQATGTITVLSGQFDSGHNTIGSVTANAIELLSSPVNWLQSNSATANAVAARINNGTATHGYSAAAVGAVITITAEPSTGATPNNYVLAVSTVGNVNVSNTHFFSGGVTAVAAIAQVVTATLIGTFEALDTFTITINGTAYTATGRAAGTGISGFVFKRRMWSPAGSLWEYSKLNTFTNWSDTAAASGASFINVSNEAEGSERLVGAGVYSGQGAIFSRRNVRIYNLFTDAQENTLYKPLDNSGTMAARSILNHGDVDLFYLDETGIRSIRAREATNEPFINDIGTAIDPFLREYMDTLSLGTMQRAVSTVEPRDGRYMLALGGRIFVLSYFPSSQISAWSYFEPGFNISDFARAYNKLYARAGDTIYLYGGPTGTTWPEADEMVATVQLPFVSTQPPGMKMLTGFDMASEGVWAVNVLVDPNNENAKVRAGNISRITYGDQNCTLPGRCTHLALEFTCASAGAASISNVCVRYQDAEQNG